MKPAGHAITVSVAPSADRLTDKVIMTVGGKQYALDPHQAEVLAAVLFEATARIEETVMQQTTGWILQPATDTVN